MTKDSSKSLKAMVVPTEEQESLKLASWARLMVERGQEPRLRLLRCGFEGLRLPMGLRCKVKRQSISRGFPDWFLAVPKCLGNNRGETNTIYYHGLFLELKRVKGGVVSSEQGYMIGMLQEQGYKAVICKGADEAIATIKQYLGMD